MTKITSMLKLTGQIAKFIRNRQGFAAFEFAIVVPVLILAYFGTVDVANWYSAHRRLVIAASTIADLTTQSPGQVKSSEIAEFWNGVGWIIDPIPLSSVKMTMRSYRKNGSTASQQWTYSSAGNSQCGTAPSPAQLAALAASEMTDGNDVLVASVCSSVSPIALQVFGWSSIDLHYQIAMRPRLGKTLDCTGCS